MKSLIRIAALTMLMLPALVSAQEPTNPLAGYWEGAIDEGSGPVPVLLELRIQGDVVTGPIFMHGFERYMRPGTVTANSVEFITPRLNDADRDVPLLWIGQLTANNELVFSVVADDREGPAREFTLTRKQTP